MIPLPTLPISWAVSVTLAEAESPRSAWNVSANSIRKLHRWAAGLIDEFSSFRGGDLTVFERRTRPWTGAVLRIESTTYADVSFSHVDEAGLLDVILGQPSLSVF
jgi:hypothetical protein